MGPKATYIGDAVTNNKDIRIGLMGLGVVGTGVAQAMIDKAESLDAHVGTRLSIARILVRDPDKSRSVRVSRNLFTTEVKEILQDPKIDIVVELLGGEEPATQYVESAISYGKHVVTANKEMMARHGHRLLASAAQREVSLLYEASVGGGIPIVGPLSKDLLANEFQSIHAIINGTTNYILSRMSLGNVDFAQTLKEAQDLGYAEPDPTNDVEGIDVAYKLTILAGLAFRTKITVEDVYREGISRLTAKDFRYAAELGYAIKLLAVAVREGNELQLRVHPTLVPNDNPLSKVDGAFNAVEIRGDLAGKVMFHGQGAGAIPTSSAIVSDILEAARAVTTGTKPRIPPKLDSGLIIKSMDTLKIPYYLRLMVDDQPGVMAKITQALGDLDVSIEAVIQKGSNPGDSSAEVVITTHPSREAAMGRAMQQLEKLSVVREVSNFVRIQDVSC